MWIVSIAEIDERHVARELRRKPVSNLGLARLPACECVSDAEPRWLSQGISGGCEVSSLALVLGRAEWTRRWKALRAWKTTAMVCRCAKGPRCCSTKPGLGWEGRAVRQGASVTRSRGLRKVRQGPTRVMSGPDGRRRQPLCRGAIDHGHGWCGGINHRATRGRRRRLRLSGAIEQGVAAKARARVRAVGSRA